MVSPDLLSLAFQNIFNDPSAEAIISAAWGSQAPSYREDIQAHIQSRRSRGEQKKYHSISHASDVGVIYFSDRPVGVDVEHTTRVTAAVITRVSSELEVGSSPSLAALWCAKEAAFKALKSFNQPSVISQISIGNWANFDSHCDTFELLGPEKYSAPRENKGFVLKSKQHTFAFFNFHY